MIRINLLPVREARRRAEVRRQLGLVGLAIVGAVLLCLVIDTAMRTRVRSAENRVAGLQAKIDDYEPERRELKEFEQKRADVERKLEIIRSLEKSRTGPVNTLDELASRAPTRLWLTKLDVRDSRMELEGMSIDMEVVADFLIALRESEEFDKVELGETKSKEEDGLKLNYFQVTSELPNFSSMPPPGIQQPGPGGKNAKRRKRAGLAR